MALPFKLGRQINGRARFYSATLRFWFPPFKNNLNTLVAHAPGVGKLTLVLPVEQFPVGRRVGRAFVAPSLPASRPNCGTHAGSALVWLRPYQSSLRM